ncbi:MAG TPA: hypothetical protein K8W04_05295 [Bacteroides reticulotermitis]|nr:hypothetical protein [Bacteroides reticulotermitis]
MYNRNHTISSFGWSIILLFAFFTSCTDNEEDGVTADRIAVKVEMGAGNSIINPTRALGDPTYSVDRVWILPFKKIAENLDNSDVNFVPEYSSSLQIDVNSFPIKSMTMLLSSSSTYKILAFGFKRTDYSSSDPNNVNYSFSVGAVATPVTLANFHMKMAKTTVVPELFTSVCYCYNNGVLYGTAFKPSLLQDISLRGELTRIVSGLTVQVTNIPTYVTSVSLVAEQLAKAIQPIGGIPTVWQTSGDGDNRVLNSQIPASGTVSFSNLILPTTSSRSTKLYLDVKYGTLTERYTIKVPDLANVSVANSITFTTNQVVKIIGSYTTINLGFVLTSTINLDDNQWDGLQN